MLLSFAGSGRPFGEAALPAFQTVKRVWTHPPQPKEVPSQDAGSPAHTTLEHAPSAFRHWPSARRGCETPYLLGNVVFDNPVEARSVLPFFREPES